MKLTKERFNEFREFIECVAVSGREENMYKLLKKKYEPYCDEILSDNLGGIMAHKKSKKADAPKVMLIAHMDEVGLRVDKILEDGCLLLSDFKASIWSQTLMASKVYVQTIDNKLINGVIDTIPPHLLTEDLRSKPMPINKMMVDIGAKSKKQAEEMGIRRFDPVVVRGELEELGDGSRLLGKAFDNRYGCFLGYELLKEVKDIDLDIDLYVGASVQEEAGCIGAAALANLVKPDLAIVLDCSPASDMGTMGEVNGKLGNGLLLRYGDRSMIAFPQLMKYQEECAKKVDAKAQFYISAGGTDAGVIHRIQEGILTLTNCVCARNIHTNASIMDLDDYESAKKTVKYMLTDLNTKKIKELKIGFRGE